MVHFCKSSSPVLVRAPFSIKEEKDDEERKAFHANRALSGKKYLYFLSGIFMQRKKKNSEILETLSGYDPA